MIIPETVSGVQHMVFE